MDRAGTSGAKGGPSGQNRTADEPGQTLNVDLCFVPASHQTVRRLPAVSGSSGRLVISGPRDGSDDAERTWPGQVFADPARPYAEAMQTFVRQSAPRAPRLNPERQEQRQRYEAAEQVALRTLRREERAVALQRGQLTQRRTQEDAAWRALCRERRARPRPYHATPEAWAAYLAAEECWRALRAQRQATLARRQEEDARWRAERQHLREQLAPLQAATSWIAILVVTDNCTRQCLGLPLFAAGPKISAEVVIAALRVLLPAELQFLISDRGTHFTAHQFAQFAAEEGFVHVLIARHRPESNGIAERFVRTLKEWLADQAWTGAEDLESLLEQFRHYYDDRPHQGLGIPGLSPNEFAARFWLM